MIKQASKPHLQHPSAETFSVIEVGTLLGETRQGILLKIKRGEILATRGKDNRAWRISKDEVNRIFREFDGFDGVISLLGLYVLATTSHQNGVITDEQYQTITDRTVGKFREAMAYPASREFLRTLLYSREMDWCVSHLYHDASKPVKQ